MSRADLLGPMVRPAPACPRCAAPLRVNVRPGPSGAYRIGSLSVRCDQCSNVSRLRLVTVPR